MTKFQEKIYNEIPKPTNYRVVKFSPLQGYLYNQFLIIVDYPVENLSTRAILSYGNGAVEEAIFLLNSPKLIIESMKLLHSKLNWQTSINRDYNRAYNA